MSPAQRRRAAIEQFEPSRSRATWKRVYLFRALDELADVRLHPTEERNLYRTPQEWLRFAREDRADAIAEGFRLP